MKKFSDVLLEATEISARQRTDIKSGYSAIDYGENGSIFRKGNLIMLASRPGMGKTTLATQIAVNAANHGSTILFLSSEYSACALVKEIVCQKANVSDNNIPLYIDDSSDSVKRMKLRCIEATPKPSMIVVDYLQLLYRRSLKKEVIYGDGLVCKTLKELAVDLDVPVLCCSQLTRATEVRGFPCRPLMTDIPRWEEISDYTDTVLLLYRYGYYDINGDYPNDAEIRIARDTWRQGNVIMIEWDNKRGRFMPEKETDMST